MCAFYVFIWISETDHIDFIPRNLQIVVIHQKETFPWKNLNFWAYLVPFHVVPCQCFVIGRGPPHHARVTDTKRHWFPLFGLKLIKRIHYVSKLAKNHIEPKYDLGLWQVEDCDDVGKSSQKHLEWTWAVGLRAPAIWSGRSSPPSPPTRGPDLQEGGAPLLPTGAPSWWPVGRLWPHSSPGGAKISMSPWLAWLAGRSVSCPWRGSSAFGSLNNPCPFLMSTELSPACAGAQCELTASDQAAAPGKAHCGSRWPDFRTVLASSWTPRVPECRAPSLPLPELRF